MSALRLAGRKARPFVATHQKLLAALAHPRWYLALALGGIAALVLGFWGYWSSGDGTHSASDAVYGSIKLFFWGATLPPETHVGVSLNVARFLAPVVAGWAAVTALVSLFRDRVQQMLIPFKRGHVVVCGLGYVGYEFLRKLHSQGYRAVVVEADGANPQIDMCRGWGFPVIVGDAQLKPTLAAAGVKRAARLLAITPDSVVNTEIVTRARRLADARRTRVGRGGHVRRATDRPQLRCLARITDPGLCVLLRTAESNRGDNESAIDFFNINEIGARLLLDKYPIDTGCQQPHIVVAHFGALGAGLVFHAARKWHDERADNLAPLRVSVVDDHVDERVESLLAEHPALEEVCEFSCYSATARDIDRLAVIDRECRSNLAEAGELGDPAGPVISRVYVTDYRDERTIETALKLCRALDPGVLVVVALSRAYAIANLLEDKTTPSVNVTMFKTLQESCSVELVEGGSFEAIAHEIYRRYCEMQPEADEPPPPWSQLDESLRESSRAQARHIGVKLRSIGCEITPLRYWYAKDFTFTDDELNKLTVMEHDRWQQEKEADGWTLGDEDQKLKKSPYLVPWEDLPPDVADWDRRFVKAIPNMLAAVGLQIIDVNGNSPRYPTTGA